MAANKILVLKSIEPSNNHWSNDKQFASEIESRYHALQSGSDKGLILKQLKSSIEKHRKLTSHAGTSQQIDQ